MRFRGPLSIGSLLASVALLVATVFVSYRIVHGEDTGGGNASPLRSIAITGPEETVFDWSRNSCEPRDIPDAPARAFRDAGGRVQLIASHHVNRREVGPDLGHLKHRCEVILRSGYDPQPRNFDDREWIASTFTPDG